MNNPVAPFHLPKWITRVGIALAAMVILYAGTAFALSRFLDPEALAAWLEPRMERALKRDVEVAKVEVGFFPLGVGLREVTLSDPTGLAPFLARVASVDLQVKFLPLFRKEVQVGRLTVDGLEADLRVSSDGRSNFGDISANKAVEASDVGETIPSGAGGAGEEGSKGGETGGIEDSERPFLLDLKSIRFTGAEIRFSRDSDTLVGAIESLRAKATVRREADGFWLLAGSSDSDLNLRRGGSDPLFEKAPLELSFDVRADGDFASLQVRTGELKLGQIALDITGEVQSLQGPVRSLSLALLGDGIPLSDILATLPDAARSSLPVDAEGVLAVDLKIEGEVGPGRLPGIQGNVGLTGGRLTFEGKRLAEDLSADLTLTDRSSVQARVRASVLDGPLSLEGTIALGGEKAIDVTVRGDSDLGSLGSILQLPDGMTTSGRVATQLRVTGPLMEMDGLRFNGDLRPALVRVSLPSLAVPIVIPEGSLQLSGIRGFVENLPILLGDDRLSISGEIGDLLSLLHPESIPRFEGSARGPRLDLRRISAKTPPDSTLTYGKVAFAKIGGRPLGGRGIEDAARELGLVRPDSLPFAGSLDLQLDTVIDRQGRMEDLRARLDFGPGFLRISDAVFHRYGGEIRTAANLTLGPQPAAPFSLKLEVQDLDALAFLSRTSPLGRFATGRISLQLDLVGTLDGLLLPDRPALVGSGGFSLSGGLRAVPLTEALATFLGMESLRAPSIQDWSTSFILEEGAVRLSEATLRGAPGAPKVGGTVGLDGSLNLLSVFDIPPDRLNISTLDRLGVGGEMAANVLRRPEVVQAILRLSGSVFNPTIQADPRAMAATLGTAVGQEVSREVQEQLEVQRAEAERLLQVQQAEAQRRIDEQKQQLQSKASGFLRNLVERRDTVRTPPPPNPAASGTPPTDTIRRDTLRPDTVRPDTTRPDTVRPDTVRPDTIRPDTVRPDTIRPDTIRNHASRDPSPGMGGA